MPRALHLLAIGLFLAAMPASASAQDWIPPRAYHGWGEFPTGTWKQVRVRTIRFGSDGKPQATSVTETRTELESVDDEGFTLRVEVAVLVNGKRFGSAPKRIRRSFAEDRQSKVDEDILKIDGHLYKTDVHRVVVDQQDSRRVTTVHVADDNVPYVLKRHTVATQSNPAGRRQYEIVSEVTRPHGSRPVMGKNRNVWHVRTVHKQEGLETTTDEVNCLDVPGMLVSHVSHEYAESGTVVRRSDLDLVSFGIGTPAPRNRRGLFQRRREKKGR